jgi:thymidylate kinase
MVGVFITFEGIDGCGKSTQLRLPAGELRVRGLEIVTTWEPGDAALGQKAARCSTRFAGTGLPSRVASKNTDRLDSENAEFHTRVRNAYLESPRLNHSVSGSSTPAARSNRRINWLGTS